MMSLNTGISFVKQPNEWNDTTEHKKPHILKQNYVGEILKFHWGNGTLFWSKKQEGLVNRQESFYLSTVEVN